MLQRSSFILIFRTKDFVHAKPFHVHVENRGKMFVHVGNHIRKRVDVHVTKNNMIWL